MSFCHTLLAFMLFQTCMTFVSSVEYKIRYSEECFLMNIIHSIFLCILQKNAYKFEMIWDWVNDVRIFILGWIMSFVL